MCRINDEPGVHEPEEGRVKVKWSLSVKQVCRINDEPGVHEPEEGRVKVKWSHSVKQVCRISNEPFMLKIFISLIQYDCSCIVTFCIVSLTETTVFGPISS